MDECFNDPTHVVLLLFVGREWKINGESVDLGANLLFQELWRLHGDLNLHALLVASGSPAPIESSLSMARESGVLHSESIILLSVVNNHIVVFGSIA